MATQRSIDELAGIARLLERALPDHTYKLKLVSALLATGTGGTTQREFATIGIAPASMNLVHAEVSIAPSPVALGDGFPGGSLIISSTAIVNATSASDSGAAGRFAIPIPPVGKADTAGAGQPATTVKITMQEAVNLAGGTTDLFFYLVSNKTGGDTALAAVTITLFFNTSEVTYPNTQTLVLAEQADVP